MRRLATLALWALTPVACVAVIVLAIRDLPDTWRASQSDGAHGRFVVVSQECVRTCSTLGDFTADDRSTRRRLYHADAPSGLHPGDSVRVVVRGDSAYRERSSFMWLLIAAVGLAFALMLGLWGAALYLRLTTPRTA